MITFIKLYQKFFPTLLSVLFGKGCRFQPTCSEYAKEALHLHGLAKGTLLSLKRLSQCHPLGSSGYDPVPKNLQANKLIS